jgi:multiple sugar transport system permease protein
MAVSIIQLLPILVIFFLAQKFFVRGVALSGMGGR